MDLGEFINYTLVEDFEFEIVYDISGFIFSNFNQSQGCTGN
jgi:hypothetical protein